MNLLLDTHIWIWNDLQPEKLSSQVVQELMGGHNVLWLSPVSIWELGRFVEKKKLQLKQQFHVWVNESVQNLGLQEASLNWEVAQELSPCLATKIRQTASLLLRQRHTT